MDFSNRRCSECNHIGFTRTTVHGLWHRPREDFPSVFMTADFYVWRCNHCQSEASEAGLGAEADLAIENSLRN